MDRLINDCAALFDITRDQALRIAARATTEAEFISIWENDAWWV